MKLSDRHLVSVSAAEYAEILNNAERQRRAGGPTTSQAGHEGRSIEVFGIALAAADIVLNDEPVDNDSAQKLAAQLEFAALAEAEVDLPDEQAWAQSCAVMCDPARCVGGRNTIAAWLRHGATGQQLPGVSPDNIPAVRHAADRVLGYYG